MTDSQSPAHYEIRVAGLLGESWAAWFAGLQITTEGTETVISGLLPDQPALHGVLAKVRDLGLGLISVRRLDHDRPSDEGPQPDRKGDTR